MAFFAVGFAQHPMLVGISLPLYSVTFAGKSHDGFDYLDILITLACLAGLSTAMFADNQLRSYMLENEARQKRGEVKIPLLETGLWRYSRHPVRYITFLLSFFTRAII